MLQEQIASMHLRPRIVEHSNVLKHDSLCFKNLNSHIKYSVLNEESTSLNSNVSFEWSLRRLKFSDTVFLIHKSI